MVPVRTAMVFAATLATSNALADQTFIACKLTMTVDDKGVVSATTGTDIFVVAPQPDGSTSYTLPAGCRENTVVATVSDTELVFECDHAAAKGYRLSMRINRVSGEYVKMFGKTSASGSSGLVHYGQCAPQKPQF